MSQEASSSSGQPPAAHLGPELVDILYSHTKLNYDVCAAALAKVFAHLGRQVPTAAELAAELAETMMASVRDHRHNPDLSTLERHLAFLNQANLDLQSGEKNVYECAQQLDVALDESILLLVRQSDVNVFKDSIVKNRQALFDLYEIWQSITSKSTRNKMLNLFSICFKSDPMLVCLLFENTSICIELCCYALDNISQEDHTSLIYSLKCLVKIVVNCRLIPLSFSEYLKSSSFLQVLFDTLESEKSFLFIKLSKADAQELLTQYSNSEPELTIADLLVHLALALNLKFFLPEDNLLAYHLVSNKQDIQTHKLLGESVLNYLNFEFDPLLAYQLKQNLGPVTACVNSNESYQHSELSDANNASELYPVNSVLKFISDMFSYEHTRDSTSIFYSNDFNVILDIIIRKLTNLGASDQIRVEYLSLIQLILKNSCYLHSAEGVIYRKQDLLACFKSILNERDADTIDQDIVRIILAEHAQFSEP